MPIQQNNSTRITTRAYELQAMGPLPGLQEQVCVSSCETYFKSSQKEVGFPHNIMPLLHL